MTGARRMSSPLGASLSVTASAIVLERDLGRTCAVWRKRCRQTLCAIAISQFCGFPAGSLLDVRAVGVEERRLCDVLRVGGVPHDGERVSVLANVRHQIRSASVRRGLGASKGVMH
jgi:hypothetical protein